MRARSQLTLAVGCGVLAVAADPASAITLTWDSDSTTTADIVDGPGNWNTTGSNTVWRNGGTNVAWTTLNDAVFGGNSGTPGQVTLTTAITPNSMTFNVDGYTIADASTSIRLILAGTGGIAAHGNATVKSFRTALMQTGTQTWTVDSGKSFTMDATPGTNTQQFAVGGSADAGISLTLGGGGTVNFIASSNTFGLGVPQNSNLIINNVTVTATGRTTATNGDNVAAVFRGRSSPGLASKTTINTGGLLNVGTNTVTVQMNSDANNIPLGPPGELHLDGGTIATGGFGNVTAPLPLSSTGALYFNGGEVRANQSNVNFMPTPFVTGVGGPGLSAVYVGDAGANINTNGFDITVANPLIPDPASTGVGGFTKKGAGTLTMTAASTYGGATNVQAGTLISTQGFKSGGALTIASSASAVVPETLPNDYNPPTSYPQGTTAAASKVSALTISGTGVLDLGNNDLAIDYVDPNTPLDDVRDYLAAGFNGGGWDGTGGIISNTLNANNPNSLDPSVFALGYAENGALPQPYGTFASGPLFNTFDVDDTTVLVKFTWVGDLNLDGLVDFQDLSVFNTNYDNGASSGRYWFEGDFNYDGFIDFSDLSLFNTNYDPTKPSLPEPGAMGILAAAAGLGALRRRKPRACHD